MDKKKIILNRAGKLATESKENRKMWLTAFIIFVSCFMFSLLTGHCFSIKFFENFFIDIFLYSFIVFVVSIILSTLFVTIFPTKKEDRLDIIYYFIPKAIKELSEEFKLEISQSKSEVKFFTKRKKETEKEFESLKNQLNDFEEEKKEFENLKKV